MNSTLSLVVLGFSCFFCLCSGNVVFMPNCTRPSNTIPLTLSQLCGVWYIHQIVNFGDKSFEMACTRIEYLMRSDNRAIFEAENFFSKTTGLFTPDNYELTQLKCGIIQLQNLRDKSFKLYYYALKFNGTDFVVSVCYTQNGNYLSQAVAILTKNQSEDPVRLENEIKSTGVVIKESYMVPQDENCFRYKAPA